MIIQATLLACSAVLVSAQFPPTLTGITTKVLQGHPGVSISYKETYICETKAKSWAGYVHMPSSYLKDLQTADPYNVSMFFWYFESRNNPHTAPTTIHLAGGPGAPSVEAAVTPGGPCTVLPDSNSTRHNAVSMNNNMNMLYIDQPVSTGFSYTKLVNSTLDMLFLGQPVTETGIAPFKAYGGSIPAQNATFKYGTFSEQNPQKTVNSTLAAAKTLWHFGQAWFSEFPEYKTSNKRVNIWGNSYGGYYVPITAEYITQQNQKIKSGKLNAQEISIDTVGWTNGCVDLLQQAEWYPEQAYNNTYDLQVIPTHAYKEALDGFHKPNGCRDKIVDCRKLGETHDPDNLNIDSSVTDACVNATLTCAETVLGAYDFYSDRSDFDMAHLKPDPYPPAYSNGFFNQAWVQSALGVPVNYTSSLLANNVFLYLTGDPARTDASKSVEYLLENGVKVSMMYGDRDYRCPWNGAEKLSLAYNWKGSKDFQSAGYEYVQTGEGRRCAVVRQHGSLSFVRVFDAGHDGKLQCPDTLAFPFEFLTRSL